MGIRGVVLSVGIVDLPDVGKTTVFNALTSGTQAQRAIRLHDRPRGIVGVLDDRLQRIERHIATKKVTPAMIEHRRARGRATTSSPTFVRPTPS